MEDKVQLPRIREVISDDQNNIRVKWANSAPVLYSSITADNLLGTEFYVSERDNSTGIYTLKIMGETKGYNHWLKAGTEFHVTSMLIGEFDDEMPEPYEKITE